MEPYRRKVRFWDVDAYGHVFNARYFVYFDDALCDLFEEAGVPFEPGRNGGLMFVVVHAECDHRGDAKLGDRLDTTARVRRFGRTSITFDLEVTKHPGGETVAVGNEVYVVVDAATGEPIPVPDDVRERLAAV